MLLYLQPRLLAVLFLGFASGLPLALTAGTLSIWLAESGVSLSTIGLFALVGTPYALKFLWSPLVDGAPLPLLGRIFGQRRSWILLGQAGVMAMMAVMALVSPHIFTFAFAACVLVLAVFSATQDIAFDAYRVEILPAELQAQGAAMATLGYRIGMLASGAGALYLAEFYSWRIAALVMAALMSVGMVALLCCREPEQGKATRSPLRLSSLLLYVLILAGLVVFCTHPQVTEHGGTGGAVGLVMLMGFALAKTLGKRLQYGFFAERVIAPLGEFMQRSGWWLVLLFILCFKLTDAFLGMMTGPFLREIGYSKADIASVVKLYGLAATLIGSFAGAALVSRIGIWRMLAISALLQGLSNLAFVTLLYTPLAVLPLASVITLENFVGGMGTTAFVAFLSGLCKREYTATQYALFSSFASVARTFISAGAGMTAASLGWELFFVFSALLAAPGLLVLWWLGRKRDGTEIAK